MNELASANMVIGGLKAEIEELKRTKEQFLEAQEAEVAGRIQNLINRSRETLLEVQENYTEAHKYAETVRSGAEFVTNSLKRLKEISEEYEKSSKEQAQMVSDIITAFSNQEMELKLEKERLQDDKKVLKRKEKEVKDSQAHLESQQETLKKSYEALKNLWEKVQKNG